MYIYIYIYIIIYIRKSLEPGETPSGEGWSNRSLGLRATLASESPRHSHPFGGSSR